ncbi:MAG: hypothetical protein IJN26_05200 [Bacteroidales bacterium]|nr:hypothetical protein [Bacteroidales bacterium]
MYGIGYERVACPVPSFFCPSVSFPAENKFGGNGKKRTFAVPNEKRVAVEAESSSQDWRLKKEISKIFAKKFGD